MAVTVQAGVGTSQRAETATSINYTSITVAAGTHTVLLCWIAWSVTPTSPSLIWDSGGTNQPMTLVASTVVGGKTVALYGLCAPTIGNKTLAVTWTGSSEVNMCCAAFDNVMQTEAAAFIHAASNNATSAGAQTVAVTSAIGNMCAAMFQCPTSYNTPTQTQLWTDSGSVVDAYEGQYANGAATVTFQVNGSGTPAWRAVGVDIVQYAAAGGFFARHYYDMARPS